eukprot:3536329-Pyramimonas_sp.AAC.1
MCIRDSGAGEPRGGPPRVADGTHRRGGAPRKADPGGESTLNAGEFAGSEGALNSHPPEVLGYPDTMLGYPDTML